MKSIIKAVGTKDFLVQTLLSTLILFSLCLGIWGSFPVNKYIATFVAIMILAENSLLRFLEKKQRLLFVQVDEFVKKIEAMVAANKSPKKFELVSSPDDDGPGAA